MNTRTVKFLVVAATTAIIAIIAAGCSHPDQGPPAAVTEGSKTLNLPVGPGLPPMQPGDASKRK